MSVSPIKPDQLSDEGVRLLSRRMRSLDNGGDGGGGMDNERIAKLEATVSNLATKADLEKGLGEVRVDIEKAANKLIMAFIAVAVAFGIVQKITAPTVPQSAQLQPIVVQMPTPSQTAPAPVSPSSPSKP